MIHKICPICNSSLSELLPNAEDRNVEHKVYLCDNDVSHKFWASEYESDSLRWNPGANFVDNLYFRKFKNSNRELVKELALKELTNISEHESIRLTTAEGGTMIPLELATTDIENTYKNTPEYTEIFDNKVHENLLSIIQSQNETINALVTGYEKLEKYTDELQEKYDKIIKSNNVTPSGIILRA